MRSKPLLQPNPAGPPSTPDLEAGVTGLELSKPHQTHNRSLPPSSAHISLPPQHSTAYNNTISSHSTSQKQLESGGSQMDTVQEGALGRDAATVNWHLQLPTGLELKASQTSSTLGKYTVHSPIFQVPCSRSHCSTPSQHWRLEARFEGGSNDSAPSNLTVALRCYVPHRTCTVCTDLDFTLAVVSLTPRQPRIADADKSCSYSKDVKDGEKWTSKEDGDNSKIGPQEQQQQQRQQRLLLAFNGHRPCHSLLSEKNDFWAKKDVPSTAATVVVTLRFHRIAHFMHSMPYPGWILNSRAFHLIHISPKPCIVLAEGFLGAVDCKMLMQMAVPEVQPSRVSGGLATTNRTSQSMFLIGGLEETGAAQRLERSMQAFADAACTALGRPPLLLGEATQLIRYQRGQHYALHYDNGEEERMGKAPLQRAATILVYLNDCPAGGETFFPRAKVASLGSFFKTSKTPYLEAPQEDYTASASSATSKTSTTTTAAAVNADRSLAPTRNSSLEDRNDLALHGSSHTAEQNTDITINDDKNDDDDEEEEGLKIVPQRGRAILFWSVEEDGVADAAALHAALKVEAGVKWVATRWCYEQKTMSSS